MKLIKYFTPDVDVDVVEDVVQDTAPSSETDVDTLDKINDVKS